MSGKVGWSGEGTKHEKGGEDGEYDEGGKYHEGGKSGEGCGVARVANVVGWQGWLGLNS